MCLRCFSFGMRKMFCENHSRKTKRWRASDNNNNFLISSDILSLTTRFKSDCAISEIIFSCSAIKRLEREKLSITVGQYCFNTGKTACRKKLRRKRGSTLLSSSIQFNLFSSAYFSNFSREKESKGRIKKPSPSLFLAGIADNPFGPAPRNACNKNVSA